MRYLDHIRRCNAHDMADYIPWHIAGQCVGYLMPALAERLRGFPDVFTSNEAGLSLVGGLDNPDARSKAMEDVLGKLRKEGLCGAARNEPYAVVERVGGPHLMTVDRTAAGILGIISTGFHLNGTVGTGDNLAMWIARRSLTKITFPGQLDNMVAGGQPATISVAENVLKECREEADIPDDLARLARPVGLISYTMAIPRGLRRHAMYVYDLDMPDDFIPKPFDGEVENFQLMSLDDVAEIVRNSLDEFKFNCSLVVIDFLIRPGRPGLFRSGGRFKRGHSVARTGASYSTTNPEGSPMIVALSI
jgi:hypothetical protein